LIALGTDQPLLSPVIILAVHMGNVKVEVVVVYMAVTILREVVVLEVMILVNALLVIILITQ
jgi:hypothetical protein